MKTASVKHAARRRGTAMIETVLAMPFLLVVFALVMLCGFWMVRVQKAAAVDRYEAWRAQAYAPGPHAPPIVTPDGQVQRYAAGELRVPFYAQDEPSALGIRRHDADGGAERAAFDLAERVPDGPGREYAEALLLDARVALPRSRGVTVITDHEPRSTFERQFGLRITHRFSRPDGDWRYVNDALDLPAELWFDRGGDRVEPLYGGEERPRRIVSPSPAVREIAMAQLDAQLRPLAAVNPLAEMIQNFYLRVPGYRGPKLPLRWERNADGDNVYSYTSE